MDKIQFWARSNNDETFDDICFFPSLKEALEAEINKERFSYVVKVEFTNKDVCNILTHGKIGNGQSNAYSRMKVVECGRIK